jgi:hypothetical protein
MNNKFFGLLILCSIFFLLAVGEAEAVCVTPSSTANLNESVNILCDGLYSVGGGSFSGGLKANNSNIIIECNGTRLIGTNTTNSFAIDYNYKNNVTIKNCIFEGSWRWAIDIYSSNNDKIINNTFRGYYMSSGAHIFTGDVSAQNTTIENNTFQDIGTSLNFVDLRGNNHRVVGNRYINGRQAFSISTGNNTYVSDEYVNNMSLRGYWANIGSNYTYNNISLYNIGSDGIAIIGSPTTQAIANVVIKNSYCENVTSNDCFTLHGDGSNNNLRENYTFLNLECERVGENCVDVVAGSNVVINNINSTLAAWGAIATGNSLPKNISVNNVYSLNDGSDTSGASMYCTNIYTNPLGISFTNSILSANASVYRMFYVGNCSNIYVNNVTFNDNGITNRVISIGDIANNVSFNNNTFNVPGSKIEMHVYNSTNISFLNNFYNNSWMVWLRDRNVVNLLFNEIDSQTLRVNYSTSSTYANNAQVVYSYNGRKYFNITGNNISLINQALAYPFNDVYNVSSASILAQNVNNYSLTLSSGQQIIVGNYSLISFTVSNYPSGIINYNLTGLRVNVTDPDNVYNRTRVFVYDDLLTIIQSYDNLSLNFVTNYTELSSGDYYSRAIVYTNTSTVLDSGYLPFTVDVTPPIVVNGNCTSTQNQVWQIIPLIILAGFLLYLLASIEMGFFGTLGFLVTLVIELNLIVNLIRIILTSC